MVQTSASAINLPMLDRPGNCDDHRLPNAVAVVIALKITASRIEQRFPKPKLPWLNATIGKSP